MCETFNVPCSAWRSEPMSLKLSLLLIPFSSWLLFAAFWLLLLLPQQEDVNPPVAFLIAVVRCCCWLDAAALCYSRLLHDFAWHSFPPRLFPPWAASRGWGRSPESSFLSVVRLIISHNSRHKNVPGSVWPSLPLKDHQLGGVACHLPQVRLHMEEERFANAKLLRRGEVVGEVGGKLEERVSELLSSVWDYCPAVPRETQGGKLASSQTAQNLDPPVKRSWQNNYLVKEVIYVCKATLYFSQRQLANKIIAKECSSRTRLQNSSKSALGVSIKNLSGPTETL